MLWSVQTRIHAKVDWKRLVLMLHRFYTYKAKADERADEPVGELDETRNITVNINPETRAVGQNDVMLLVLMDYVDHER